MPEYCEVCKRGQFKEGQELCILGSAPCMHDLDAGEGAYSRKKQDGVQEDVQDEKCEDCYAAQEGCAVHCKSDSAETRSFAQGFSAGLQEAIDALPEGLPMTDLKTFNAKRDGFNACLAEMREKLERLKG